MKKNLTRLLSTLLLCQFICQAYAQPPIVFTGYDLNPFSQQNSNPTGFKSVNGKFVFSASTDTSGNELWVSDGTQAGTQMLVNFHHGSLGSDPSNFTVMNGKVYFSVFLLGIGVELWETDGTAAGTKLVKELATGVAGAYPKELTLYNGKLYFQANYHTVPVGGYELCVSDGTSAGTYIVKDIWPGYQSSYPKGFTVWNGKLYFSANDGTNGTELWVTDGTAAGTVMVKDINPGSSNSDAGNFFVAGSLLYFSASTNADGTELWKTDGTGAGTQMVKDIRPGVSSGFAAAYPIVSYNGKTYFYANDGIYGPALWVTDGTTAGTQMLKDINNNAISTPSNFLEYNNKLYFRASNAAYGAELWRTDGTAAGTVLAADIYTGSLGSHPAYLTVYNNLLYFIAHNSTGTFRQLWQSDGTAAGTNMIAPPAATYSNPCSATNEFYINPADNKLYFAAQYYTATGRELWSIDSGPIPTCDSPTNLTVQQVTASNALVVWDTVAGITGYEYYVLPHPATTPASATTTISHAIIVSGLSPSTTYDVCVRSKCINNYSAWSCDSLRTTSGTGIHTEYLENAVRIYPNPSNGTFNVSLSNGIDEHTMITVYDITGRMIVSKQMNTANETISIGNAAKGVYTIRIVSDNDVVNKRIVIE